MVGNSLGINLTRIKELPKLERPREKAIRYGIKSLSNEELLAILIGTGTAKESALDLAHRLNGENRGLVNLFNKSYRSLLETNGIGPSKALILSACFELSNRYQMSFYGDVGKVSNEEIYNRYKMRLAKEEREIFVLIILNRREEIIHEENLYLGGEESVYCSPLEIVKKVIYHQGKNYYVLHNHPSGDCHPSESDRYLTSEMLRYSQRFHVKLIDHIIIAKNGYYSFKTSEKP